MNNLNDALVFGIRLSTLIKAEQFDDNLFKGEVFGCHLPDWIKTAASHKTTLVNSKTTHKGKTTKYTSGSRVHTRNTTDSNVQ